MPDDRITNKIKCLAAFLGFSDEDAATLAGIAARLEDNTSDAMLLMTAIDLFNRDKVDEANVTEVLFSGNVNNTTSAEFDIPSGEYMAILCDGSLVVNQLLDANASWQDMAATAEPGEQMMCVGSSATITTTTDVNVTIIKVKK